MYTRVASDPTNVRHTGEPVFRVNVKDILDGHSRTKEITSGGVDDTLRLTGRTGSLHTNPTSMSAPPTVRAETERKKGLRT